MLRAFEVLFIITAVALFLSLLMNAKQFFARFELTNTLEECRSRLVGPGGHLVEMLENEIRGFDSALLSYQGSLGNRDALDKMALQCLIEDLRLLSSIDGYGERVGWAHAFSVFANIRTRLIVGRFVLTQSSRVSEKVLAQMDHLLKTLRGFAALGGLYYDFRRADLPGIGPADEAPTWPDLSLAQLEAKNMQDQAKQLWEMVGSGG